MQSSLSSSWFPLALALIVTKWANERRDPWIVPNRQKEQENGIEASAIFIDLNAHTKTDAINLEFLFSTASKAFTNFIAEQLIVVKSKEMHSILVFKANRLYKTEITTFHILENIFLFHIDTASSIILWEINDNNGKTQTEFIEPKRRSRNWFASFESNSWRSGNDWIQRFQTNQRYAHSG